MVRHLVLPAYETQQVYCKPAAPQCPLLAAPRAPVRAFAAHTTFRCLIRRPNSASSIRFPAIKYFFPTEEVILILDQTGLPRPHLGCRREARETRRPKPAPGREEQAGVRDEGSGREPRNAEGRGVWTCHHAVLRLYVSEVVAGRSPTERTKPGLTPVSGARITSL